jgi:multiple sugar transport system permease protein
MSATAAPDTTTALTGRSPAGAGRADQQQGGRRALLPAVILLIAAIWTIVPLGWMLLSSFKDQASITASSPQVLFTPTLQNYANLVADGVGWNLLNSVIAALGSTIVSLVLGTAAGYGLARTTMKRKDDLSFWVISVRMAPIAAVVLPLFLMFSAVDLVNTLPGVIIAYTTFNLPFCIWLTSAFFADIPPALEEAAANCGATPWQTFWKVSLPMVRSGLVTAGVLCLVFSWNDYAFATVLTGPDTQTLPIAASQLVTSTGIDWGRMTSIGVVVVVPMFIAGLAVKRWLVTGLTLGAVTGE